MVRFAIYRAIVAPDKQPVHGVKYLDVDTAETISSEPVLKLFNDALAEGPRRA
jgi:hypothetical protein